MQQKRNVTVDIALGGLPAAKPSASFWRGYEDVFTLVNRHHEEVKQLHRSALAASAAQPLPAKKVR